MYKYGEETYPIIKPVAETSFHQSALHCETNGVSLCAQVSIFISLLKLCHCRKHQVPIPPFLCDMLRSLLGILFVGMSLCQDTIKIRGLCAFKHAQNPHYLLLNSELTIWGIPSPTLLWKGVAHIYTVFFFLLCRSVLGLHFLFLTHQFKRKLY